MRQGVLVNGSVGKVVDFRSYNEGMSNHSNILAAEDEHGTQKEVPKHIKQSSVLWPVVQFTNGREYLCIPTEFTVNNVNGDAEATRTQVSASDLLLFYLCTGLTTMESPFLFFRRPPRYHSSWRGR